ncbi:hypothetical protein HPB47_023596 [Ixodes persulcatus]|uniref:Uncharacterized protein n=1 Tax=Ixodes persulcatus TaxID=34615 RepID=A0AC60Q8H1_IXOPE|nr:hypothetical protein HPB47_023596 [Ixodes persulcatus]
MPNSADNTMEFDAQSGRTLVPPGPWQQILREPTSIYKPSIWHASTPTTRLRLKGRISATNWTTKNCALALSEISTIQLGAATHEILPYLKPLPGTRRGVIHGLDPGTTTDQLPRILAYNGARILHARMLGNSTSAVVTFEGIHVPFYIKAYGLFTRCRPYRQTVHSDTGRTSAQIPTPQCALSATQGIPHQTTTAPLSANPAARPTPTASKDCRKKLRPPPPPLRVRERALTSQRWQQQPSSNSQPPEQRQFPPNQPNQQQVSWSAIASPPPTAHDQFPLLPPPRPAQTPDPRIQTLQQENTLLKQQLEATNKRTTTLEQRIEQLLMQVELLLQHQVQRPQDPTPERDPDATPPLTQMKLSAQHQIQRTQGPTLDRDPEAAPLTSRAPTPVPTNISHLERIIYEMAHSRNRRSKATGAQKAQTVHLTPHLRRHNSSTPPPPLTVWQWNCRSFRNKKPSLTLLALQHSPDLIALQETNTDNVPLRGYTTYATDPTSRTAVLVQATQTAQTHTLPTTIDYTFVELLPRKKTEASLYVLNIYSPPTQPLPAIDRLLRIVRQRTRGHKLVVLGDFNAQHTAWASRIGLPSFLRMHGKTPRNFPLRRTIPPSTPISSTSGTPATGYSDDPELTIDNQPVPNVPQDGSGAQTILFLQRTLTQLMHLIRRVSHRHFGLQETGTLRIVQAILISRVTYGTPYLALKSAEKEKLNVAIRQAYKAALGLPTKTATRKLLQLGVHNTWEEIQEAHRVSQFTRLKLTPAGRATLSRLGYTPPADCEHKKRIPLAIRHSIKVAPIPRNMHPIYNKARREARIRALKIQYEHSPDSSFTRYTDASPYPQQPAHAVSVTDAHCKELTTATILTTSIETAEELALALAATTGDENITILTDSQAACRNFLLGRISPAALKVLQNVRKLPELHIVWTPGHESFEGNEAAHAAARAHTHRAVSQEGNDTQTPCTFKPTPLQKYADILAHYRHERRQFPPPHPYLSRAEATAFRRLQTNSYSHGTLLHAMYPTLYPATCNFCSQPGTLYHIVWECQQTPSLAPNPHATLRAVAQRSLVERARAARADHGFPD